MTLDSKTILLCVTGGIAAYKACELTSRLVKEGADVHVVMTTSAKEFVSPTTFQALSRNPVHDDTFTEKVPHQIAHIDLADKADLVIVAPATANAMGKLASGIADDMVTTVLLATRAPVFIAPAMNVNMYDHPALQQNLKTLKDYGYYVLDPGEGNLACGWIGKGRMAEPMELAGVIQRYFSTKTGPLAGQKLLVTAGPTQEKIDPVRYLTNRSSGKMGYAIAVAARDAGADVTLVTGPTLLDAPSGMTIINVTSAQEMYETVTELAPQMTAIVKTAAVADYRPANYSEKKVKKGDEVWTLNLERNPDILATLGERKQKQILVGFAAESNDLEVNALKKLQKKNLDIVVANNISQSNSGFQSNDNEVTFYYKNKTSEPLKRQSKTEIATLLIDRVATLLKENNNL